MSTLKTRRRYKMMGNDYSSQEVKMFAANCHDPAMIKVFEEGRNLYSEVASMVYHLPYDECCEFRTLPDGTKEFNLEGKKRRTNCKSLILGIQYGRGITSIAEQIKDHDGPVTKEDKEGAKKLLEKFFDNYPLAKVWMDKMHNDAKNIGYVEDLWGRRRRLPGASLPKYTFESIEKSGEFNPLLSESNKTKDVSPEIISKYTQILDKTFSVDKRKEIIEDALKYDKVKITNNGGFIAQAERQALNSPIQGGSATMTKLAIRNMCSDKRLNELDFHLLAPIHDEVIAEAPLWNVDECCELMGKIMCEAGKPECPIPMSTDGDTFNRWYEDVLIAHLKEDFEKCSNLGMAHDMCIEEVCREYNEFTREQILQYLNELKLI